MPLTQDSAWLPKQEILDTYVQHTQNCSSCSKVLTSPLGAFPLLYHAYVVQGVCYYSPSPKTNGILRTTWQIQCSPSVCTIYHLQSACLG